MSDLTTPPPTALHNWLAAVVAAGGSDLHIAAGSPPVQRLHGDLVPLGDSPLSADETQQLLGALCSAELLARLHISRNLDLALQIDVEGVSHRFRGNLFFADGALAGCFRHVAGRIPTLAWAGLPEPLAKRITSLLDGLVIVTGATGSGKSTTLAILVNIINQAGGRRIITIEEPIEHLYPQKERSLVTQREVGRDVLTFADGLKYGLRQDPDVILVGEIRDQETAQMALSAAETGHLVFTTLHTRDAKGAISRYADLFPQETQRDTRQQLALSLRTVLAQRLLPNIELGGKRHLALEVLWNTNPIGSAIRQGKLESIDNYLLTGREEGMLSFDESVRQLLRAGKITRAVAEQNVRDASVLGR
jgi:twitching motility protein PilT